MNRDIQRVARTLAALPDRTIVELVRRAGRRESAFTSGSRVTVSRGSSSDPVAAAVIGRLEGNANDNDLVYDAIQSMALNLRQMAELAMKVDQGARFVLEVKERSKESQMIHCEACRREVAGTANDRLRSGYCARCYMAWLRAGKPYRTSFEISLRNSPLAATAIASGE